MRYIFKFPDIGEGLDEGTIMEWYVEKGQEIKSGDPLVNMETDKVVTDIPSPKTGVLIKLFGKTGDVVKVGDPLVEIEIPGIEGEDAVKEAHEKNAPQLQKEDVIIGTFDIAGNNAYLPPSKEVHTEPAPEKKKFKAIATPVARALARELEIDINAISGSGPGGRVMKEDILNHRDNQSGNELPDHPKPAAVKHKLLEIEPLSQIRKTIAKNMIRSKHTAAHMTAFEEADAEELIRLRGKFKEKFMKEGVHLSYLPFLLKATSLALKKHRVLNAEMDMENNRMIYKKYYNIGIAVDTPDGLIVPVINDVDKKSIFQIAKDLNEITAKAREKKITMDDLKDGTFTVTNFGSIGGMWASPLINYPQAAILGIGRMLKKPVIKNDEIVKGTVLPISLTVDHRIIDGGEASRFINQLMDYITDPASLIME